MRSVKPRYDSRALADIGSIFEYIAADDPAVATRVVARIRSTCEQLARHPHLGRKTNWPGIKVRPVVRYPYLVFFILERKNVVILHVRHMSRDVAEPGDLGL